MNPISADSGETAGASSVDSVAVSGEMLGDGALSLTGVAAGTERQRFENFVRENLGDVAVMDRGRYISPKIEKYWLTWQAAIGGQQ
jgi:hypothetical protein